MCAPFVAGRAISRLILNAEEIAMKKNMLLFIVTGLIGLFGFAGLSFAAGKDDAKTLVKNAVAYVKYQGKGKTLAEISKPRGMSLPTIFRVLWLLTPKIRH
jgi:hypothetical protein